MSWGGKLAVNLVRRYASRVASLALVAPGLFPLVDLPAREKISLTWAALAARRRLFRIPINEPKMFTATPCWLDYIRRDPLRLTHVTAAFLMASRRLDRFPRNKAGRHTGPPIHVFLAEHDRIIDNDRTRRWLRELPWPRRQITEYRGAHHTLEFEPQGHPYPEDLLAWIRSACHAAVPPADPPATDTAPARHQP